MGSSPIQPRVAKYFADNPSRVVRVDEISQSTGFTKLQIQNSIGNAIRHGYAWAKRLTVETRGSSWIYDNSAAGAKAIAKVKASIGRMFEQIGQTREGVPIVQDEDGVLFRLIELK